MVIRLQREEYFLEYNVDNIFINLIQLETHLRNLDTTDNEKGHSACLVKHLAEVEGESSEAISHSATIAPEKTREFKEIKETAHEMRKKLGDKNPDEMILEVRALRKRVEKLNPEWDTSNCKACEVGTKHSSHSHTESFESHEDAKVFKPAESNSTMVQKEFIPIVAGNLVGGVADIGVKMVSGVIPDFGPVTGGNILGIAGGVGIAFLSAKFSKKQSIQLAGVAAGSYMVAKNLLEIGTALLNPPLGGSRLGVSSPSGLPHRRLQRAVPDFTNGSTIQVD